MGAGMSTCFAQAGYEVALYDIKPEQLDWALSRIDNSQRVFIEEELISAQEAKAARDRITITTRLVEALEGVQYVLEAAPEKLDLKQRLFQRHGGPLPGRHHPGNQHIRIEHHRHRIGLPASRAGGGDALG